jgi:Xaa-Pro aminopeptidase
MSQVEKVKGVLRNEKADALLVWNHEGSGQPATAWLSGFMGTASVLLITRTKQVLITDGRYTAQSRKEAKGFKVFITSGQKSAFGMLDRIIRKEKMRKILFDGAVTAYSVAEKLKQHITPPQPSPLKREGSKPELISKNGVLQELRLVKEKGEIRILAEAARRAGRAFTRLVPLVKVGMTEKEIAEKLETLCKEEGAEGFAFPTSVASGKNGALPHAKSTDKKVKKGELITVDFGIKYRGYCSDMTRMLAVGKVSPRLRAIFEAVKKAQELACKKAKAGMTGKEIDMLCRNYLIKKGLGKYFTHSTGHGVGMEVHELPVVSSLRNEKIPAGAVITIEPGVYIPNVGGARIEDALVLTKTGSKNLSKGVPAMLTTVPVTSHHT